MIHAMPKRMWYVENYLIPSMVEQGIEEENISIYNDKKGEGNLRAWINSTKMLPDDGGTWHLQDDVIISHDFKEKTEELDDGIICGFTSKYDDGRVSGWGRVKKMWWSFLCIRVPNKIMKEAATWGDDFIIGNPVYREYWEGGVNDDWVFRQYVFEHYPNMQALNLEPNIADHIDFLIGGTVNSGTNRKVIIRSLLWKDEYLVKALEEKLQRDNLLEYRERRLK